MRDFAWELAGRAGKLNRAIDTQARSLAVSKKTDTKWNSSIFVEQFHFLWNSSTICGTASNKCGTAPQKVEHVLFKRVSVQQIVEQNAKLNILNA